MTTASWQGTVVAESDDTTVVEGNHYFPAESVRAEYLRPSDTTTVCGWKGTAEYYTLDINGQLNPDAAWYYRDPLPDAEHVRGRVAFWRGVEITE
ncbi:DUF427 domain-containing protein [Kitasatospora sp. NBC_01246]|uniref:DUF427 domain-containing protein n=1 Tax=Kitasatospora sp. NBC_01246 TaxID=2903570 RepID=UPI002E34228A|nr:DUF427 domain-containing protein [Kitasatospora sp. NBC_01246]